MTVNESLRSQLGNMLARMDGEDRDVAGMCMMRYEAEYLLALLKGESVSDYAIPDPVPSRKEPRKQAKKLQSRKRQYAAVYVKGTDGKYSKTGGH